jgi:hypothetical protein
VWFETVLHMAWGAVHIVRSSQSRTVSTQALIFWQLASPSISINLPGTRPAMLVSCECRVLHAVCRRPVLVHGGRQRLHGLPGGQVRQHAGLVSDDMHSRVRRGVRVPGGVYVGQPSCRHVCIGSVRGGRGDVVQ